MTPRWYWLEEHTGEIILASDDFCFIEKSEWEKARISAINKPTAWPEGAKILVQDSTGMWNFGTWLNAYPSGGAWTGKMPENMHGCWMASTLGRADIAGWDWAKTLEHRPSEPQVSSPEEEEAFRECERRLKDESLERDMLQAAELMSAPLGRPSAPSNGSEWGRAAIAMAKHVARQHQMNQRAADQLATVRRHETEDPGAHYRRKLSIKLTQEDIDRGYVDVNLDPYRICDLYDTGGGPREQIVKKGLRGESKGQTERDVIKEMRSALDRWDEMLNENERIS